MSCHWWYAESHLLWPPFLKLVVMAETSSARFGLGGRPFLNMCTVHAIGSLEPEGGGKGFGEFRRWDEAVGTREAGR